MGEQIEPVANIGCALPEFTSISNVRSAAPQNAGSAGESLGHFVDTVSLWIFQSYWSQMLTNGGSG